MFKYSLFLKASEFGKLFKIFWIFLNPIGLPVFILRGYAHSLHFFVYVCVISILATRIFFWSPNEFGLKNKFWFVVRFSKSNKNMGLKIHSSIMMAILLSIMMMIYKVLWLLWWWYANYHDFDITKYYHGNITDGQITK